MKIPAPPENPAPLPESRAYEATRQFIHAYALPQLALSVIFQGWQNRAPLPKKNDFAVMSALYGVQHGTTVERFQANDPDTTKPGILDVRGLIELGMQIDFCADSDTARLRAQRLAVVARSSVGVQFFNDYGLSALYADDPRDISFVSAENQYVRRWMVTLHLSVNEGLTVELPYFNTAAVSRLENVDVHHHTP